MLLSPSARKRARTVAHPSERTANGDTTRRSLSFYVLILVGLQVAMMFGFIASVSVNDFRSARKEATQRAAEDATKAAALIDASVDAAGRALTSEAALPGYAAVFADPSRCTVTSSGAELFTKGEFHVLRSDGSVACSSVKPASGSVVRGYQGQPWLSSIPGARRPVVAGPLMDPVTRRPSLIVAVPITEVPGAVALSLDVSSIGAGLDRELGDRVPPSAFVVTSRDRSAEIARSSANDGSSALPQAFTRPMAEGASLSSIDGVRRIHAEDSVSDLGWHVVAGISTGDVYQRPWKALRERGLLAAAILLIIAAVGWMIHRRVTRPIRALSEAVEDAADGNHAVTVPEDGPAEVRRLGRRFNRMLRERAEKEIGLVELFPKERREGGRREIDRIKSAFLMAVSHELRTPLAVVTGYAELLEEQIAELSDEETVTIAHNIRRGAGRLERILLDILDLERMSRGTFEAHRRSTHLCDLVTRVVELSEGRDDVRIDVPKGLVVDIDPGLTERILDNLIRNAAKHTPAGTPLWVKATYRRSELEVIVEDAGPGIPDELKPEVFEPFTQGETPKDSPGTGVGLSLVAQFARLHKGRAWVDDRPGGGARFHVTFADAIQTRRQAQAKSA